MTGLISVQEFRAEARADRKPGAGVWRLATVEPFADPDIAGARRIPFCLSDDTVDRMGDTIAAEGWELDGYRANPVVLWAHDSYSPPIGKGLALRVSDGRLLGDVEFAAADLYEFADLVYRLVKGGYINAGSVGFNPLEWSFARDKEREFGIDFERQELLEFSVVPVPANAHALVEARAKGLDTRPLAEWAEKVLDEGGRVIVPRSEIERLRRMAQESRSPRRRGGEEWHCGAARDLPLDESDAWDGGAAAASIFEWAGGDDFSSEKARKGFLLYDGAKPELRGSYKDPFAHATGGTLKAVKGGIRAAASRLPQSDASAEAKQEAEAVIKHYEEKFGMGDAGKRFQARADGGGMNEGDGSAGGYVANCGRSADAECGLKDPSECMIHGPSMEDKALARIVARQVAEAVRRELAPFTGRAMGDDAAVHLSKAMHHVRLAGDRMKDLLEGGHNPDHVRAMQAHCMAAADHCDRHLSLVDDAANPMEGDDDEAAMRAATLAALAPAA